MPVIKTEAIILKCSNYREKSKIITFFTKSHGKLTCIAKGVRDTKTKWGGSLQPMAYLNIMYYYKENRQLQFLSNAEYVKVFRNIYENNEKTEVGFRIIDLVNKTTADNNPNNELLDLLITVFEILDYATKNFINVLFYFECKLAVLLGFGIDIEPAHNRVISNNKLYESYLTKDYTMKKSSNISLQFSGRILKLLTEFIKLKEKDILKHELNENERMMLDNYLTSYFKTHIEDLKLI
jgi:DNA repair protein RecO (recombination protein O)